MIVTENLVLLGLMRSVDIQHLEYPYSPCHEMLFFTEIVQLIECHPFVQQLKMAIWKRLKGKKVVEKNDEC